MSTKIKLAPRRVERDVLEFVQATKKPRVDWERGVIRGVKIVGFASKNGGTYSRDCLEAARALYEGTKCNINHPNREQPGRDRNVEDRFGVFSNVQIGDDGAYADLHFLKTHPMARRVCEAAEEMPDVFGFSHNAKTIQVPDGNGGLIHQSITRVRSVDLVADAATTQSIFESEDPMNDPHTQDDVIGPSVNDKPPKSLLDTELPINMEPKDDKGVGDPLDLALNALIEKTLPEIKATLDSSSRKALLNKLKAKLEALITALGDEPETKKAATDVKEAAPVDDGSIMDEEKSPKTTTESCKKVTESQKDDDKIDYEGALDVLESANVQPTKVRVKALLAVGAADREALVKSWPTIGQQTQVPPKPKSSSVLESNKENNQTKESVPSDEDALKGDALLLMSGR